MFPNSACWVSNFLEEDLGTTPTPHLQVRCFTSISNNIGCVKSFLEHTTHRAVRFAVWFARSYAFPISIPRREYQRTAQCHLHGSR